VNHNESKIQQNGVKLVDQWFELTHPHLMIELESKTGVRRVSPLFAIQNAYNGNPVQGARSVREGVRSGVFDLCLPIPYKKYHSLYIEVKTEKGRMSKNQKKWGDFLNLMHNKAVICRSPEEILRAVVNYMGGGGEGDGNFRNFKNYEL
jgi:hypothetical protein